MDLLQADLAVSSTTRHLTPTPQHSCQADGSIDSLSKRGNEGPILAPRAAGLY